jgi:hypothetical protein
LVAIAERIEQAIRLGRIADSTDEKSFTGKGKKSRFTKSKMVTSVREKNYQNKDI